MNSHEERSQSRIALVTGAGSGIGRAICELFVKERFRIVLVGRREQPLDETIRKLTELGAAEDDVLKVVADIAQPKQAASVIDTTLEHMGRLDVLINNAGFAELVPLEQTMQEVIDRAFGVNAFGPMHLVARAWPWFVRRGGCIINISSMSTLDPFPGLAAYAAAKSALESLTRSIMNEGRQFGIRAFTIAPGSVETRMLRGLVTERDLPRERTLDSEDVAQVVVDCAMGRRETDIGRVIRLPSP